jgi:opacity protein-like surface antigen
MKSMLRVTVSVSAIALGIALSSHAARAADAMEQAYGPDWYVSVFGGVSFARAHTAYNTSQYDIKLKDGFSVGAAIGRHIGNGFRTESELSYVENANKAYRPDNGPFDPDMNGHTASLFMFGNLWKDIRLSDSVQPYIGGGLGTGLLIAKESQDNNWDDSRVGLAAQLGVGVRVALSDRIALDAGYRLRAVIDASLNSFDGNPNSVYSYYSHTAQLGVSYALGENSQILHGAGGEPSDWYVSMFAGGTQADTIWGYSGNAYSIDHKLGFTVGGAIGTHLAPGLRTELELSYARSALDSYSTEDGTDNPAGGHLEQGFLLGNIWKDFELGAVTPYIGGGLGFGAAHFDNANAAGSVLSDDTGYGLAGQFGFGARVAVSDNLSVDLGYRFKSIVDASIIGGNDWTDNSDVSTHIHVVQLGLNYGLGEGTGSEPTSGVPDSRYVSLFGGIVRPQDTYFLYDSSDYLVKFKTGFTVGAAVGQNLTENLRGEIEVAFQTYDVGSVDDSGSPNTNTDGDVKSYFLLANMWRDFDIGGFHPYAGGGVGMAFMDVDVAFDGNDRIKGADVALAAQVGSGIRFDVTDNMTIDAGYRFKAALGVFTEGFNGDQHGSASHYTHTGQVGVSWKF